MDFPIKNKNLNRIQVLLNKNTGKETIKEITLFLVDRQIRLCIQTSHNIETQPRNLPRCSHKNVRPR